MRGPEEFWPFGRDRLRPWRGDEKGLEAYREALRQLEDARREMWRSFPQRRRFWQRDLPEMWRPFDVSVPKGPRGKEEFRMDMDVRATDDAITVKCDMPGMKKEDIDISLEGNVLTIKGERTVEEETKDEKGKVVRRERRSGSFSRSFTVPGEVKTEDIKTSYEDGVLTVIVPREKVKPEKEKAIKIKIGTI